MCSRLATCCGECCQDRWTAVMAASAGWDLIVQPRVLGAWQLWWAQLQPLGMHEHMCCEGATV